MKAALIGHGMVAGTHLSALSDSNVVELAGLLGRDFDRAQAYGRKHAAGAHIYPDLRALCSDPSLDFAIVTTPPNARADIVSALAEAGLPVLMEKPIERDLAAATEIVAHCEARGVVTGVIFQHRMRVASQALKALVDDGALGDLVAAEIRVPWWRDQDYYDAPGRGSYARDGGGVMISQAIHTLDLALWLLGPVARVQAMMTTTSLHRMEAENWAGALMEFEGGAVATLTATTSFFPGGAESISIQGTKAHARLENGILEMSYLDGRSETLGEQANGTGGGADAMAFTHQWHQGVIEDFAAAITDKRAPSCTGRFALQSHAVIDAMERSTKTKMVTEVRST